MDTTKQLEYFRHQLARKIEQEGYSYRKFSLSLGKSSNYISSILSGDSYPSFDMLLEISDALCIDVGDLFGHSGESYEMAELMPKLRKLSPAELSYIGKFIDLYESEKNRLK